ncbi:major facilitator superfamily domain-containing protein [Crucibulum laeve]|uniref:Major facilitator superfamily domain-containing protein n=1 Tax=Crucibulum laeve TaxID=68775 RepID=A0A5C3M838_9AGAR|nr:major facilitator superfamily domain-containing protein [Crucibulum laeve]
MSTNSTICERSSTEHKFDEDKSLEHLDADVVVPTTHLYFLPIPKHLQYRPGKRFPFNFMINVSFGIAGIFLTANLYYCQPLLIELAKSFDVSYQAVSRIPTLLQAGYAVGLLFISPLGDIVRRRPLFLSLVFITTLLTIGLAVTNNVIVFEVISFLVGVANVTPQILIPLTADLAPPDQRGFAYSIVLTGLLVGLLLARVIAGVLGQFTSWRVVYYMALGGQVLVLIGSYFIIPDYPAKNKGTPYWRILWTMAKYTVTEPIMVQVVLVNIATSACFSSYWVTLTFLLGGPPYFYSTLVIGLFGLLGLGGVAMGPLGGRIVDNMPPWHAMLISTLFLLTFQAVQLAAGGIHIAAVIIACFGFDAARQVQNIALATSIFSISMDAVSRLNAVFVLSFYIGQIMGTAIGTKVFVQYGWRAAAGLGVAWFAFQILVLLARGPHCERYTWVGYEGGISRKKRVHSEENDS